MRTHGESGSAVAATLMVVPLLLCLALALAACGSTPPRPLRRRPADPLRGPRTWTTSKVVFDVRYMTGREGSIPPLLDVWAPKRAGPWPLVVMLHGGGVNTLWLSEWATKVAQRGAVVFVPEWSRALD